MFPFWCLEPDDWKMVLGVSRSPKKLAVYAIVCLADECASSEDASSAKHDSEDCHGDDDEVLVVFRCALGDARRRLSGAVARVDCMAQLQASEEFSAWCCSISQQELHLVSQARVYPKLIPAVA